MPDFQPLVDSLNSPPTRHAMFVHMPIALSLLGAIFAIFAATLRRNRTVQVLALGTYAALVVAAFLTTQSGEAADEAIGAVLTPEVYDLIHEHEEMGEQLWLFAIGSLALLAISNALRNTIGVIAGWLAVVAGAVAVGWVAFAANLGGELVYRYGVGTPKPVACFEIPGMHSDGREHAPPSTAAANAPAASQATARDAVENPASLPDRSIDPAASAKVSFFLDQAYPILSEHCFNCHNASRVRAGKSGLLDQTSREAMLAGGRSGPAIVPGDPDESLLIQRMRHANPDLKPMPPNGTLPDEQIAIIEQWIRDGAEWPAGVP